MDRLIRRRGYYLSATLTCALLAVSFQFNDGGTSWIWAERPQVALVLAVLAGIFATLLLSSHRQLKAVRK